MHMHLVFFQILDRDGFTRDGMGNVVPDGNPQAPPAEQSGWKDTAMVAPNEILRVIVRFDDYKGLYAYHCHILEHEDHEMMRQFQTVSCGDAELDPTEACDDGGLTDYDGCSARCRVEEFAALTGTAVGGGTDTVDMIVSGWPISVTTTPGQTAAEVALALAAAINADANLQALGVTATAVGERVVVEDGEISDLQINDAGLSDVFVLTAQPTRFWWGAAEGATDYDLVSGDLIRLGTTAGDYSDPLVTEVCLADDRDETYWVPAETPLPGEGVWYLVRGQPGGTYDTGGAGQAASRDAGIAASGNGCP
jgi:cysteine-rich repeat protein